MMFFKQIRNLEARIKKLEEKAVANSFELGAVDLQELVRRLPELITKVTSQNKKHGH